MARMISLTQASPMIQVEKLVNAKFPDFSTKPAILTRPALALLKALLRERDLNAWLAGCAHLEGFEFVDRVLEDFDFTYSVVGREKENIPAEGRVVIVANHPLGTLDGLALLKLVSEVRQDVRIVANDVLMQLQPLQRLMLPVANLGAGSNKSNVSAIHKALAADEAVIVFPSGEVSRAGPTGIRDGRWHAGFLRFAEHARAPVLPVFLDGRNSALFYSLSMLFKPFATLMLVREMYLQKAVTLPIRIGELISWEEIAGLKMPRDEIVRRFQKQVYGVRQRAEKRDHNVLAFRTQRSIAHPEPRVSLRRELQEARQIGETRDGKQIWLCEGNANSALLREIGRLREVAFRRVGEGSGRRRDVDAFDGWYRHLVLWDDADLQVAGAYRLGEAGRIVAERGVEGLYSSTLFEYGAEVRALLPQALELGRSFVQPRYWGMRSLDYLWHGVGAYLRLHPEVRYLFGPVSISNACPAAARDLLVYFYRHYFGAEPGLARARNGHCFAPGSAGALEALFKGLEYKDAFRALKEELARHGSCVPPLYKHYTDLTGPEGASFLDFGIDAQFSACVDGLVWVDTAAIKPAKRERYLGAQRDAAIRGDGVAAAA